MGRAPKRGRPPKEGDVASLYLTIPKPLYDYLRFLARNTYAGADIGEVASHLLKLKVAELGAKLEVPKKTPTD
jgi:hypothetical protein